MMAADVVVVIGPGSFGQAIARRAGAQKKVLLADLREGNVQKAADVLADAGFDVATATVDVSSRESVGRPRTDGLGRPRPGRTLERSLQQSTPPAFLRAKQRSSRCSTLICTGQR